MRWLAKRIAFAAGMAGAACALATGCASTSDVTEITPKRTVNVHEFSTSLPAGETSTARAENTPTTSASTPTSVPAQPASVADAAPAAASSSNTPPVGGARLPGQENVVESVIGQVSGRPIFADEFLEPISDQLRREAERLNQEQFVERARKIIEERLRQVVINELFLAEAEAALTPQQQMGLLAFLKDMQEKTIAERGGTIFGAQKRIAEEEEMTLEEFEEAQRSEALIRNLIFERISPRVIVSWRDVQREYELRKGEFNPSATVTIKRLRLNSTDQKDQVEAVKSRLATGAPFDMIVTDLSLAEFVSFVGEDGRFTMSTGSLGDLDVADSLKAALAKIKPEAGQTTEAIESRGDVQWLHVAAIEQPPAKTLFDVQQQLIAELQARRFAEEQRKYVDSLFQKGIFDELEIMLRRALTVALMRYRQ